MKGRTPFFTAIGFLMFTCMTLVLIPSGGLAGPQENRIQNVPVSVPPFLARPAGQEDPKPKLKWDNLNKQARSEPGQFDVPFTFKVSNPTSSAITIKSVRTSCGCTVAKLPKTPWVLEPGEEGEMAVNVNVRGKSGNVTKTVTVLTSSSIDRLTVSVDIPVGSAADQAMRARNMQIATADRQAIFKNDCAECHAKPTVGKMGHALYDVACGICHDAEHRASMVPDLHNLPHETNAEYWQQWIVHGKVNTLMPAFAKENDGPLNAAQIKSLVEFMVGDFKNHKAHPETHSDLPVQ